MKIEKIIDNDCGDINDLIDELNRFKIDAIKQHSNANNFRYEIVKEEKHFRYEPSYTVAKLKLYYDK